MTSEEETAFKQQPGLRRGCRVHAVSSAEVVEAVRGGGRLEKICALSACSGLALRARIADQC